jgi:hypothetical protein
MRKKLVAFLAYFAAVAPAVRAVPPGPLVGRWHGSSLCQVKPSPCHDEEVVYRIARRGGGYSIQAAKIVAGVEEDMGTLAATFAPATGTLAAVAAYQSGGAARWEFQLRGDRLSGRLVINGNTLFRRVEVLREPARLR